jgi:hypothetical protein
MASNWVRGASDFLGPSDKMTKPDQKVTKFSIYARIGNRGSAFGTTAWSGTSRQNFLLRGVDPLDGNVNQLHWV